VGAGTASWYDVLELDERATQDEIVAAYKRLRKRWHPDANPEAIHEATDRFQAIQNAWETLGDARRRAAYDADRRVQEEPAEPMVWGVAADQVGGAVFHTRPRPGIRPDHRWRLRRPGTGWWYDTSWDPVTEGWTYQVGWPPGALGT
jgi:curved DNA-binding protein CbpA